MSKQPNIVVIAGLSGVGKSYLIDQLKYGANNFVSFSAGTLIKKQRSGMSRDELRLLDEEGIIQNQYLLIKQLLEEIEDVEKGKTILFDAHMLIDTDDGIIEIPLEVFSKINPSQFIFLHAEPEVILERRSKDISRSRPKRTQKELRSQQDRALSLAIDYSSRLNVPILAAASSELDRIRGVLTAS